MVAKITFHGAAGTVTGSCYRVEHSRGAFLVECGLFQGNRTVRDLNNRPFPFDPASDIDYLMLTHAHIDHCGLVPKLVANGFRKKIHATHATEDLMQFLLPDGGAIQESDAERVNRRHKREGKPLVKPAYTRKDAERALKMIKTYGYEDWFSPGPGVKARYWNAGHILGSGSIEVVIEGKTKADRPVRILFSGDLGPDEKVFYKQPEAPEGFDYVLCESTYGARDRKNVTLKQRRNNLRKELVAGLKLGGNVIIPSFAMERSQELLHDIGVLMADGEIPGVPVFLDSPLATKVTSVFMDHAHTMEDISVSPAKLFKNRNFKMVQSVDDSKAIARIKGGAIIMSASGMCDAGRIKHHLRNNLWDKGCTVLFVGYQAPGSLGNIIQNGAKRVRIHGNHVEIKATIRRIGNYSAHADQGELVDWIMDRQPVAGAVFLTHGEDDGRVALKEKLIERGLAKNKVLMPKLDQTFELVPGRAGAKATGKPAIKLEQAEYDWSNDYAELTLELSNRLNTDQDPAARRKLLQKIRRALGN